MLMKIDLSSLLFRFGRVLVIAYLAIFAGAYCLQRQMLYVTSSDAAPAPATVGLATVRERILVTHDHERLVAWQATAAPGQPTILYFHGNAGTLALRAGHFQRFVAQGWGFLAIGYRGFSGSTGSPTEVHNIADALMAYDVLRSEGVAASAIIAYGESLGTGVAVQLAVARPVAAVVLESPYTSAADVAAERFPYLPVHAVMWDRYDTRDHITRVRAPILILHGAQDEVIPVAHGRTLAARAGPDTRYVEYPEARHTDVYASGGFEEVKGWVEAHSISDQRHSTGAAD